MSAFVIFRFLLAERIVALSVSNTPCLAMKSQNAPEIPYLYIDDYGRRTAFSCSSLLQSAKSGCAFCIRHTVSYLMRAAQRLQTAGTISKTYFAALSDSRNDTECAVRIGLIPPEGFKKRSAQWHPTVRMIALRSAHFESFRRNGPNTYCAFVSFRRNSSITRCAFVSFRRNFAIARCALVSFRRNFCTIGVCIPVKRLGRFMFLNVF